jgi:hypothetical protein
MEPADALSASAQVAVAVAGFAGRVAAFGWEPIRGWSPMGQVLLRFLHLSRCASRPFGNPLTALLASATLS